MHSDGRRRDECENPDRFSLRAISHVTENTNVTKNFSRQLKIFFEEVPT
jgi:hypothetical protein